MNILTTTAALIEKDFGLIVPEPEYTEEQLLEWLAFHVSDMLEHRPEQLFTALYLIDVDEKKFRYAISPANTDPADLSIARLILERLRKKAETRLQYSSEEGDW